MYKKWFILAVLILGFTFQICFAENIKFRSTSKGTDGNPLLLTGVLTKPEGSGPFPAVVLLHGWCVHEFGTAEKRIMVKPISGLGLCNITT